MADQPGTLESLAGELGLALSSLEGVLTPQNAAALFAELGLDVAPELTGDSLFMQTLENAAQRAGALLPEIGAIFTARDNNNDLAAVQAVQQLLAAIAGLATALDEIAVDFVRATAALPEGADLKRFALTLVERLLGDAVVSYMETTHPFLRRVLSLLSVIEMNTATVTVGGVPTTFVRKRLHLDRVSRLLNDPLAVFHDAYGWGDNGFDAKALFANVRDVFDTLIPIATTHDADEDGPADLDLFEFLVRVAADANPPGFEGQLFADPTGQTDQTIGQLTETCRVALQIEGGLADGLALRLFPPAKLEARAGRNIAGRVALMILGELGPENDSFVILGESGGSRLQAAHVSAGLVADLVYDVVTDKTKADFRFEAKCTHGELVIDPSGFDGLLTSVLPSGGVRAPFEAGLVLSSGRGLTFNGSGGLDATFPVGLSLGAVTVPTVHMSLHASESGLAVEVSASVGVSIGPVHMVIDRVGIATAVTFPSDGGNLGVADLDLRFKPPKGVGLAIDAQVVVGAGYLDFYPDRGEYVGTAQLRIKDKIQVKAIGLILTKPEVSFLLLVSAEFPPMQLGLGFKLNGVGGLAGIHRGINEAQLFAGLRDNTLDDLLFPADPLQNIHELLGKLNGVFPPAKGRYTFGLMGLITWGPQDLVTIKLGLIVEFPTALRLVVVGTFKAAVTKTIQGQEVSILHLQVNFAGLIDFDEQFIRFDAALYQSTLLGLGLEGEMALRLKYGANPDFVMTLGGFHPDFQPPALQLPADLRRLQITLRSGNPHIWIDAYLAVTANTFQFGAGGHLRFSKWGVQVSGDLGFDALFQFIPFRFAAGVYFHLSAAWKGHEFASIEIDGVFSGPSPWRIRGQFKLKICWFLKISVSFDLSWGDDDPTLLGLVDVLPLLVEDLRAPANWERTPGRTQLLVTARQSLHVTQNADDLWLHPNDLLTVRQNTVPLGLPIDKFSEKRPQGASKFTVALQAADGTPDDEMLSRTPVKNHFAPGQFFQRSDEEKLQAQSYELFDAGVTFDGLDGVTFEAWSGQEVAYEIDYVDDPAVEPEPPPEPPEPRQAESQQDFDIAVRNNTLANSALARRARPRVARTADQITEPYVVAHQATLAIHDNLITDSETEARLLLRDLVRKDPRQARELTVLLKAETP